MKNINPEDFPQFEHLYNTSAMFKNAINAIYEGRMTIEEAFCHAIQSYEQTNKLFAEAVATKPVNMYVQCDKECQLKKMNHEQE